MVIGLPKILLSTTATSSEPIIKESLYLFETDTAFSLESLFTYELIDSDFSFFSSNPSTDLVRSALYIFG